MLQLTPHLQPVEHRFSLDLNPLDLALLSERSVDIVIVDYNPVREADIRELIEKCSSYSLPVVILINSEEPELCDMALQIPAQGFLVPSELTLHELAAALGKVADGTLHLPPVFAKRLLSRARHQTAAAAPVSYGHTALTPREQQALELLVEGLANKQIARQLGISQHGAKRLVANVLSKLNCPNRTMAVAVALREHLVDRPGGGAGTRTAIRPHARA
ncbi:response regulator transcription factor [Streptomyces sp. OfavH-34-F]|uniref:response regulator transcription factor n=1 Tax=unclassified Streptomyces TaxID=2593676 RepID=UPI001EF1EDC7|nr:response regulator transcription factor [Streptomyces sp. OfavH-34-F]MCG7526461.1 response regulator transcription factor [Streptomyces sp. OfavH-34-F]